MTTFNSPQVNQWGSPLRKKPVANTGISAGFAGESRRYRLEAEGCFVDGKHAAPQPGVGVAFQPVFRHPGDEVDPSRDADATATQSCLKPKTSPFCWRIHMSSRVPEVHLVTARGAARMLGISVRSVWRLAKAGDLPQPVQVGHSTRWRVSDLLSFIYNHDLNEEETL